MIKSIQIKSEESTFLMPNENQEIEQHLTVSSSGRVWLSRFGFSLSSGHILLKGSMQRLQKIVSALCLLTLQNTADIHQIFAPATQGTGH